jgi:hypothetical protein
MALLRPPQLVARDDAWHKLAQAAESRQVLVVEALRRCATGLAILRASAADGADGFVDAAGEAWETSPPTPSP